MEKNVTEKDQLIKKLAFDKADWNSMLIKNSAKVYEMYSKIKKLHSQIGEVIQGTLAPPNNILLQPTQPSLAVGPHDLLDLADFITTLKTKVTEHTETIALKNAEFSKLKVNYSQLKEYNSFCCDQIEQL